jgi:hypothetical protein
MKLIIVTLHRFIAIEQFIRGRRETNTKAQEDDDPTSMRVTK